MKVLTDWFSRVDPVREGLYLFRPKACAGWSYGEILSWQGDGWYYCDGFREYPTGDFYEWRGLAFDPDAATHGTVIGEITDGKRTTGDVWLVEVPR